MSDSRRRMMRRAVPIAVLIGFLVSIVCAPQGLYAQGPLPPSNAPLPNTDPSSAQPALDPAQISRPFHQLLPIITMPVLSMAGTDDQPVSDSIPVSTGVPVSPSIPVDTSPPAPWQTGPHLGYGANVAAADHAQYLPQLGFDWAKGWVEWRQAGAGPAYSWTQVDNQLRWMRPYVHNLLLRVHKPVPNGVNDPPVGPQDLAAFKAFASALAAHVRTSGGFNTVAYEIWNEPNLTYEWGGRYPSPEDYTTLLKAGYEGIKAGDPNAIVVSAGLAPGGHMDDLVFLQRMYQAGAKPYFDALGSHPYGGNTAPNEINGTIYFRRAEEQRAIMEQNGDRKKQLWATEFGWLVNDNRCDFGPTYQWMVVSPTQQAQYLVDAFRYADQNWPWMGPMFIFNLDFGLVPWYGPCEQMRGFSIFYSQNLSSIYTVTTRPAAVALRALEKHYSTLYSSQPPVLSK